MGAARHSTRWSLSGHRQLLQARWVAQARLAAKFKASVKDGEGQEGMSPPGRWGPVLFEELLEFRCLTGQQVPFLLTARFAAAAQFCNTFLFLCFHSCLTTSVLHPALSTAAVEMDGIHSASHTVRQSARGLGMACSELSWGGETLHPGLSQQPA